MCHPGLRRDQHIASSGGITQKADRKRNYVVRPNGYVVSCERTGWFRRSQSVEMHPGDTVVVPLGCRTRAGAAGLAGGDRDHLQLAVPLLAVRSV